jgi:hypothetical protein
METNRINGSVSCLTDQSLEGEMDWVAKPIPRSRSKTMFWLFNTTGMIFGPIILALGWIALVLCVWATLMRTWKTCRAALVAALLPFLAGVYCALVGYLGWWRSNEQAANLSEIWLALGKACLAGLVVTVVPLVWSWLLLRRQRSSVQTPAY